MIVNINSIALITSLFI